MRARILTGIVGRMTRALIPLWFGLVACDAANEQKAPPPEGEVPMCQAEGWTVRPFIEQGGFGPLRRQLADDFTVRTEAGDWNFREAFSGCESYVFVPDNLTVSPLDDTPLLDKQADLRALVTQGPRNVHYFFVLTAESGGLNAFVNAMSNRIERVLGQLEDEEAAWWAERLHVVSDRAATLEPWVEEALLSPEPGFAIDRFQRIRGFGNLADVTRFSSRLQNAGAWPWEANLAYLMHEVQYYNYESDRQDTLDAIDWTPVYLYAAEDIASSGKNQVMATLPDAMDRFRHLVGGSRTRVRPHPRRVR